MYICFRHNELGATSFATANLDHHLPKYLPFTLPYSGYLLSTQSASLMTCTNIYLLLLHLVQVKQRSG